MNINENLPKKYSIDDLSELTGFSRRTIRFYIQENIIEPPAGRGRGGFYFDSHLSGLSKIKQLQEKGLNLENIRKIINKREDASERALSAFTDNLVSTSSGIADGQILRKAWARYELSEGIELNVRRDIEVKNTKKINEIIKILNLILKETGDD